MEMAIDLLSVGLDPEKCVIFVQSEVKEHAELHLLLSMVTPLPWVERVPTFKDMQKELEDKDLNTYGYLGYPVLQTADIILYKADIVPVGEDQAAHLELAREIARRFNRIFGPIFPEPQILLTETPRLAGTDGRKMSKSFGNAIYLKDPPRSHPGRRSRRWSPTRGGSAAPTPASRTTARSSPCTTPSSKRRSARGARRGLPDGRHRLPATARPSSSSPDRAASSPTGRDGRSSRRTRTGSGKSSRKGTARAREAARETMDEVRAALRLHGTRRIE